MAAAFSCPVIRRSLAGDHKILPFLRKVGNDPWPRNAEPYNGVSPRSNTHAGHLLAEMPCLLNHRVSYSASLDCCGAVRRSRHDAASAPRCVGAERLAHAAAYSASNALGVASRTHWCQESLSLDKAARKR